MHLIQTFVTTKTCAHTHTRANKAIEKTGHCVIAVLFAVSFLTRLLSVM